MNKLNHFLFYFILHELFWLFKALFNFFEEDGNMSLQPSNLANGGVKHQKTFTSSKINSNLLAASIMEAGMSFVAESKECMNSSTGAGVVVAELSNQTSSSSQNLNGSATTTISLTESSQNIYYMMQSAPIDVITAQQQQSVDMNGNVVKIKLSPTSTPSSTSLNGVKINYAAPQATTTQSGQLSSFPIIPSLIPGGFANATTTITLTSPLSASPGSITSGSSTRVVRDERRRANHNEGKLDKIFIICS